MIADEEISALELDRSVFDSDETNILSTAFERAWCYLEFDPLLENLTTIERQSELARCLMVLLKLGDTNPVSIANCGIGFLRKTIGAKGRGSYPPYHQANGLARNSKTQMFGNFRP
jgi:hypothetical protein